MFTITRASKYDEWRADYDKVYDAYVADQVETYNVKPVKIAILDTGVDAEHPCIMDRNECIKGKKNWAKPAAMEDIPDRDGHGTFVTSLVMDYLPTAELYLAKIADDTPPDLDVLAQVSTDTAP